MPSARPGRCSVRYQVSKASRSAGLATTARTMKYALMRASGLDGGRQVSWCSLPDRITCCGGSLAQGCGQGHSPPSLPQRPTRRTWMPDLIETVADGVATLTLNRPENLNALSDEIRLGLLESIYRLGHDENVGCIVLTGSGRGFCAGGDVKTMAGRSARVFEERAEGIRQSNRIPMLMHTTPKVIIGMVNGVAGGAGLSMAAACDLRIAARSARFGTGFIKIGLPGDWGGTWTITRLIGTAKARELFFTGDIIGAEEALRIGLVNKVVDDAELQHMTMEM